MLVTKRSPFSGKIHTLDVPVTQAQLDDWNSGTMIQEAMPNVSPELREFLMTGITPEEWKKEFGE